MRRATTLEARLIEWGHTYGGSRYESLGGSSSPLASMMKWHGRAPSGLGYVSSCCAADDVQDAIDALSREPNGDLKVLVMQKEYLTPGQPLESKLQKLRNDDGYCLQRTTYYKQLREARKFVADFLGISDDMEEACAA